MRSTNRRDYRKIRESRTAFNECDRPDRDVTLVDHVQVRHARVFLQIIQQFDGFLVDDMSHSFATHAL